MIKPYHVTNPIGVSGRIQLELDDYTIWNKLEFIKFLNTHQGKVIDVEIPEGACLSSIGVYDLLNLFSFKSVNIRTNNIVETAPPPYKLEIHGNSYQYFNIPPSSWQSYHQWTGNYIFGALYNRPSWDRIGLASFLYNKHEESTLLNFRFNPHNPDERIFFKLEKLFQIDANSLANFTTIAGRLPQKLEIHDGYTVGASTQQHTNQLAQFYPDFLIDIVCETFLQGRSFYPTEKTVRPMLLKKPFILMGPKCFLIHLRQMGFKTFYEFWDEDYDGHSPDVRYLKILELINLISTKSKEELFEIYIQMQPILDHNYNLLIEKKFIKEINYVE
jgi:hypothetical protein